MKKIILTLCAFMFVSTSPALAGQESRVTHAPFVPIIIDSNPGEVYYLGYNLDARNQIVGVYYQNEFAEDPAEKLKSFSLAEMIAGTVLIQKTNGNRVYDLVRAKINLQTNNTYTFTLDYLRSAISGARAQVQFGVKFDAAVNHFEAFELTNQKVIIQAQIMVKTFAGQAVGIDTIILDSKSRRQNRMSSARSKTLSM